MENAAHLVQSKAYLLFPLLAGLLSAIGTVGLKSSSSLGIESIRTTIVCNVCTAIAFLGFYNWSSFPSIPHPFWPVLLLALLFVLGQIFTVLAVAKGDISTVGPVFGIKVVVVGFLAAFVFGTTVGGLTWAAAVLSVIGIACLQVTDRSHDSGPKILAIFFAFLGAAGFAGFDTMTQYWSPIMGFGNLVPPTIVLATLFSLVLLPRKSRPWRDIAPTALRFLAVGAFFFTLQSVVMIRSIGAYGDAAGANVAYSSRGLWGIFLVWWVGSWFGNTELLARPPKVIAARVIGAGLVSAATVLVFL